MKNLIPKKIVFVTDSQNRKTTKEF